MKNVFHKKSWNSGIMQVNVEPPPISLIKVKYDGKQIFCKLKLHRDPTSSIPDLYELKISLFDNGDPQEFLFVHNFNLTQAVSGTLETGAKGQYLCTLVYGEALHQFYLLSDYVESTENLTAEYIIKGLALYFPPVNLISKQKRVMRRGMRKPHGLKLRRYAARLV